MEDLNCGLNQCDLFATHRTLHLRTVEYIFFSNAHETFTEIDHLLRFKINLDKFERLKLHIIYSMTIMELNQKKNKNKRTKMYI